MPKKPQLKTARTGHTLLENSSTQPLVRSRVFNNPDVVCEGWYPLAASAKVKAKTAQSFVLLRQRLVLFRGEDGRVRALDAFCPHMGADLGNGTVVGNQLQCYFHQWQFAESGAVASVPCLTNNADLPKASINCYPVQEMYGWIWVYSKRGLEAPYPVPKPFGLENAECDALYLGSPTLFAHHHVLMINAIDLQHFRAVHKVDIDFAFNVDDTHPQVFDWDLEGAIPSTSWKLRLGKWLLEKTLGPGAGQNFGYRARFAGGSVVALTYGLNERMRQEVAAKKRRDIHVQILWGCVPLASGVSKVHIFVVQKKAHNLWQRLRNLFLYALTFVVLTILKDDDIKAFPNMRFQMGTLIGADRSAARLSQLLDKLPASEWGFHSKN